MVFRPTELSRAWLVAASTVLTAASAAAADYNSAAIRQEGTANRAFIEQVSGIGNEATIHQGRDSAASQAAVFQAGEDNVAHISQDGGAANFAAVTTLGDRNGHRAREGIVQNGSHNTAITVAVGNDNRFSAGQASAGGPNLTAQLQIGGRNFAAANQSNDFGSALTPQAFTSLARTLPVDAPGAAGGALELHALALPILAANATLQIQAGDDNRATASQHGSSNLVIQKQVGDRNSMSAEQTGSFNFLTHVQIGNDIASPTVSQTGGAAAVIVQTR